MQTTSKRLLLLLVSVLGPYFLLLSTRQTASTFLSLSPSPTTRLENNHAARRDLGQDRYSIIVSTYDRVEHLHQFLNYYGNGSYPHLDAIFVAWGLGGHDPPTWLDTSNLTVPVHFERAKRNSLTERFRKPEKMRTETGFWVDDDVAIPPEDLELAFSTHLALGRENHQIVGFSGRLGEQLKSGHWVYTVLASEYSMVLTNSAFLDTQMLEWFWQEDERIQKGIELVDELMNCEDILLNFVVSSHNNHPPFLVDNKNILQIATSGTSNRPSHYRERSACVEAFTALWDGKNPLVASRLKIASSAQETFPTIVQLEEKFKPKVSPWAKNLSFTPVM